MEEDEYKSTYNELASVRCVFEKALVNHQASQQASQQIRCSLSKHFYLADREGYSCKSAEYSAKCRDFLKKLRESSAFVLKLHEVSGPLPHNMEIRVQAGGVTGLAKLVGENSADPTGQLAVEDISWILSLALEEFGTLENLPYSKIIQSVVQFQGRRRRSTR